MENKRKVVDASLPIEEQEVDLGAIETRFMGLGYFGDPSTPIRSSSNPTDKVHRRPRSRKSERYTNRGSF